jgi:peptidyl-prolyl cis-trans isomerase B (cyclophilin B)
MARTTMPHSASSQFFINTSDNSFLDYPGQDGWGYCVFGKVVASTSIQIFPMFVSKIIIVFSVF